MEEILHQLRLVVYPIVYKVYISQGGFLAGFLNHQQYLSFKWAITHFLAIDPNFQLGHPF